MSSLRNEPAEKGATAFRPSIKFTMKNLRLEDLTGEVQVIVRKFCKDRNLRYSQFNIVEMRHTILEWELNQQLKKLYN